MKSAMAQEGVSVSESEPNSVLLLRTGMYLANQLDGKIFKDPSLLPSRAAYSQFVQTKARADLPSPTPCKLVASFTLHRVHGPVQQWNFPVFLFLYQACCCSDVSAPCYRYPSMVGRTG